MYFEVILVKKQVFMRLPRDPQLLSLSISLGGEARKEYQSLRSMRAASLSTKLGRCVLLIFSSLNLLK